MKQKSSAKRFSQRILEIVRLIPKGKVLSYGHVAALAGSPRAARQVGAALKQKGSESKVPWQRVINSQGMISTYRMGMGHLQRQLLESEGVVFDSDGRVSFADYQWQPSLQQIKKLALSD